MLWTLLHSHALSGLPRLEQLPTGESLCGVVDEILEELRIFARVEFLEVEHDVAVSLEAGDEAVAVAAKGGPPDADAMTHERGCVELRLGRLARIDPVVGWWLRERACVAHRGAERTCTEPS